MTGMKYLYGNSDKRKFSFLFYLRLPYHIWKRFWSFHKQGYGRLLVKTEAVIKFYEDSGRLGLELDQTICASKHYKNNL